jgi:hypothetical protein
MQVGNGHNWGNLWGQAALGNGGKARWAYPNEHFWKEGRERGI